MQKLILLLVIGLLYSTLHAQQNEYTYLRTGAVQNSWYTTSASIDTLLVEVKPKGLYAEISMTMDFSTRGLSFSNGDSLEIQMMFQLPPDIEITDMQLWVFGYPVPAGVYDRWTASQIYEEIVSRRTDPAILYNYTYNDYYTNTSITNLYRFNIFPMLNNLPRKCKITYQVPLRYNGSGNYRVPLPIDIARLSDLPIQEFTLRYFPGSEFDEATLAEAPSLSFETNGTYQEADMTAFIDDALNISFTATRPAAYLGVFDTPANASDFYQFSFVPNELFDLGVIGKKAVVLFDYVPQSNSTMSDNQLINGFLSSFLPKFSEEDSLNILFSSAINQWVSEDWLVTDSATKVWINDEVDATDLTGYTDLANLLLDAIQFITENGDEGNIVLISNTNQHANLNASNQLISTISPLLNASGIKLHVIDVDDVDTYTERFWVGDDYFYGNEYLFATLSGMTGGEYWSIQNVSYADALDLSTFSLSPSVEAVDVHITRDQGIAYQNYQVGSGFTFPYADQPVGLTGITTGTGDFNITCTVVEIDGTVHQTEVLIPINEVYVLDTVTDNIWGGLKQRQMYALSPTNAVVQSIIENSKQYRALSKYTAFLALEPAIGPLPITNENPFGGLTTNDLTDFGSEDTYSVYPNPFSSTIMIDMNLVSTKRITIEVYDLQGKLLLTLLNGKDISSGRSLHSFDASCLASGLYIVRISDADDKTVTTLRAVKQ